MIKLGDRAKGFEVAEGVYGVYEIFLRRTEYTNRHIGVEGTIVEIYGDIFRIEFDKDFTCWYPIQEYLAILREERLKELGI